MRDLQIKITADETDARQKIGALEAVLSAAKQEARDAGQALDKLNEIARKAGDTSRTALIPELQKAGTTLADAKAKVAALNDELKTLRGGSSGDDGAAGAASIIGKLTTAVAGYVSVRAVLGAIQSTAEFANNLQRMASQTGLGTDALQELNYASKLTNVSMDSVTSSISQMERRLAEGGDSGAIRAVQKLGFSLTDIREKGPQAFFDIANAVGKVESPFQRAQEVQAIFGRGGAQLLPVIENLEEIRKQAHDVGAVMDTEAVAAMGKLNNTIDQLTTQFKVWVGQGLTPALERLNQIERIAGGLGDKIPDWLKHFMSGGGILQTALDKSGASAAINAVTGALDYGDYFANGVGDLPGVKSQNPDDAAALLQGSQRRTAGRGAYKTREQIDADNGLMDPKQLAALEGAERSLNGAVREQIAAEHELQAIDKILNDSRLKAAKAIREEYEKTSQAMLKMANDAVVAELNARKSVMGARGLNADGSPVSTDPFNKMQSDLGDLHRTAQPGISQQFQEQQIYDAFIKAQQDEMVVVVGKTNAEKEATVAATNLSRAHSGAVLAVNDAASAFAKFSGYAIPAGTRIQGGVGSPGANNLGVLGATNNMGTPYVGPAITVGGRPPGFASGTDGFQNFGSGTMVELHGWEKVTPAGKGDGVSIGGITINGNVDSERTARSLADQVAEQVMRRIRQTQRITFGKS